MHRLVGFAFLAAACGTSTPAATTVGNREAPPAPTCPADPSPFGETPPVSPADECIHGAAEALLAARG